MGNCLGRQKNKKSGNKGSAAVTIAVLGLDDAGKTVASNNLAGVKFDGVSPTVGFTPLKVKYRKRDVTLFDLGGGPQLRKLWPDYFAEIHGFIFVVDSSKVRRMNECRQTLSGLLDHEQIRGKPFLVLGNKQDAERAMDDGELTERLDLETLVNDAKCPCRLEMSKAIQGQGKKLDLGIQKGFEWLIDSIDSRMEKLGRRVEEDVRRKREEEEKMKLERKGRVQKLRDARAADRRARGLPSDDDDDDDDCRVVKASPFKRVDRHSIAEKDRKAKEAKRVGRMNQERLPSVGHAEIRSRRKSPGETIAEETDYSIFSAARPTRRGSDGGGAQSGRLSPLRLSARADATSSSVRTRRNDFERSSLDGTRGGGGARRIDFDDDDDRMSRPSNDGGHRMSRPSNDGGHRMSRTLPDYHRNSLLGHDERRKGSLRGKFGDDDDEFSGSRNSRLDKYDSTNSQRKWKPWKSNKTSPLDEMDEGIDEPGSYGNRGYQSFKYDDDDNGYGRSKRNKSSRLRDDDSDDKGYKRSERFGGSERRRKDASDEDEYERKSGGYRKSRKNIPSDDDNEYRRGLQSSPKGRRSRDIDTSNGYSRSGRLSSRSPPIPAIASRLSSHFNVHDVHALDDRHARDDRHSRRTRPNMDDDIFT